jgi:hypothetical protein
MVMNMKTILLGLSGLMLLATGPAAAAQTIERLPPSPDLKDNGPTAWEPYKKRQAKPSVDQKLTDPILKGAIDLHAHFGPDSYGRQWDAFEIARLAKARGMRGIVLKNHWVESAGTAFLVRKHASSRGLEVFGALALNAPEGGINPDAIRYFVDVEGGAARIIWMPTHDSEHEVSYMRETRPFVRVSKDGVLIPEVLQVIDLIAKHRLTLATGHVTPKEALMILAEAKARGVEHMIVTHPGLGPMFTDPTIDELKQAVALGGHIEIVAPTLWGRSRDKMIEMIRTLGPQNCFVSSDSGLVGTPNHPDALVMAIRELRKAGFSEADLDLMFRRTPAKLIGLPPLAN